MKIKLFSVSILLVYAAACFCQNDFRISGEIKGLAASRIIMGLFTGEKTRTVDSVTADSTGHFAFNLKQDAPVGVYRLTWGNDKFLDLVWNKENIEFYTLSNSPADSIMILKSIENNLFYSYIRLDRLNQAKLELLMPVIDYYPEQDRFYREVTEQFENVQYSQIKVLDSLGKSYPKSFAVRMFRLQQAPFLKASLSKDQRIEFLKLHFFDHIDFNDTLLLHSNAWANKAIAYLSLYGNSKLSQKQLETEFIKAITVMLSAASVNADVYKFLLDYFLGGFDKYHFEEVVTYIADNFHDPFSCEDQARKTALQKKLDNFKRISIGKIAPDIDVPDTKGKIIRLSEIKSEYTLLIFWSSECGHCTEMMPKVKQIYDNQKPKRMEILAVSIDTSRVEWNGYLKEEKLNWVNVSDLKGFNSKAADDYNIYATPTMFLLDREKKILAKPISYRELEQTLRDNKLL